MQWLANLYAERGDTTAWKFLIEQAVDLQTGRHSASVIPPLNSLISYHLERRPFKQADSLLALVKSYRSPTPFHRAQIEIMEAQSAAYRDDYAKAVVHLKRALAHDSTLQMQRTVLSPLADYLEMSGQPAEALAVYRRHHTLYQQLINELNLPEAKDLENQLELSRREREAEKLRHLHDLQNQRIHARETLLTVSLIGLVITLGLLIYALHFWQRLRRAHRQLTHQAADLHQAKETAEATTLAKTELLSTMSHEMRTPLSAVISMTHLLGSESLTPDQKEFLDTLRYSADHLLSLINGIDQEAQARIFDEYIQA